ncbi:uncharacterized protein CDAR_52551 [Caerostris darwini]|uniref:Uncharacterized protein n=1 Tax=Caerostris darwini TaxID=1538125 RepID=A0AAV4S0C4_9ARAC|nr:uncharacterized protein CDAR_52551 [Caerostris darwini]
MAAEFHRKTAALFEEFKKRELHFLNTEMNINNSINLKKNINLPLQEYLQKVNKREQETEKTYRDVMKQMEELDKRTDQMSLKLEKLKALRNITINSSTSSWPSVSDNYDRILPSYYTSALLQNTPQVLTPTLSLNEFVPRIQNDISHVNFPSNYALSKPELHSKLIQTEHIFCENCHYPLTVNPQMYALNDNRTTVVTNETFIKETSQKLSHEIDPHKTLVFKEDNIIPEAVKENYNLDPKPSTSEFNASAINEESHIAVNKRVSFKAEESNAREQISLNEPSNEKVTKTPTNNALTGDFITHSEEKQYIEIQDDLLSNDGNFERAISKSDDESMNHEFDFLESDKRKNSNSHKFDEVSISQNSSLAVDERNAYSELNEKSLSHVKTAHVLQTKPTDNNDKMKENNNSNAIKSDSSSQGVPSLPLHSENISAASESDSSSEKDVPLTASAAYQALLGNVNVLKTKQKSAVIDSDSTEDEIEAALATAVRRSSNIVFDTEAPDQKIGKRKESTPETIPESNMKSRGSISMSKPQNKLSKNTRKVLGLDTSSGSEVEIEVKATINKKEEDSDEFDFYD